MCKRQVRVSCIVISRKIGGAKRCKCYGCVKVYLVHKLSYTNLRFDVGTAILELHKVRIRSNLKISRAVCRLNLLALYLLGLRILYLKILGSKRTRSSTDHVPDNCLCGCFKWVYHTSVYNLAGIVH